MKIVIVSNGHGEDTLGATLGSALLAEGLEVCALPLVGRGKAYESAGFAVHGPRLEMPSGGFVHDKPGAFLEDVRSGLLPMVAEQYHTLRRLSAETSATLAVGDWYCLCVASLFGARPLFQMQSLVSVRNWQGGVLPWSRPYGLLERLLMRCTTRVYPRDTESAEWLRQHGVSNLEYLGNPMLDAVTGEAALEALPPYLMLLPGSRTDAYESLPKMLEACRLLRDTDLTPVVAWAGLPVDGRILGEGWRLEETGNGAGETHRLVHADGTAVALAQRAFKTVLSGAKLALSTAGAAAEQTAGHGVPLVAFPTSGPQFTPTFAANFKQLLGEALELTRSNPATIEGAARALLEQPERYGAAVAAGRRVMGEPGATRRIARDIAERLGA